MGALATAVHSGKALYAGPVQLRRTTLEQLPPSWTNCSAVHHQPEPLEHLDRTRGTQRLKETAHRLGKGLITFSPLDQAIADRPIFERTLADSRIAHDGRFLQENAPLRRKAGSRFATKRPGCRTRGRRSRRWHSHGCCTTACWPVLVGASRPQQRSTISVRCGTSRSLTRGATSYRRNLVTLTYHRLGIPRRLRIRGSRKTARAPQAFSVRPRFHGTSAGAAGATGSSEGGIHHPVVDARCNQDTPYWEGSRLGTHTPCHSATTGRPVS